MIRVTVWNEYKHERELKEIKAVYPEGIHGCIADFLKKQQELSVRTAVFDEEEHGLTEEVLDQTDVLILWNHALQEEFSDEVAERIHQKVLQGMGLIVLHSAHLHKAMKKLLGTSMTLQWRDADRERLYCLAPSHPIAAGVSACINIPKEEMYGEYFDIPKPDDIVFAGWFAGGELFRSGCTFQRGYGKIFYFQPGHEEYPIYYMPEIQKIITNAVYWCAPVARLQAPLGCPNSIESAECKWKNKMKKAIFLNHLMDASKQSGKSLKECFSICKQAGYQGIEIDYDSIEKEEDFLHIKQLLDENELGVSGIYFIRELQKDDGLDDAKDLLEKAKMLGCHRILSVPGFLNEQDAKILTDCMNEKEKVYQFMDSHKGILEIAKKLEALVEMAKAYDIRISLEDYDSNDSPCATMYELLWFMEHVKDLGYTLDLGNFAFSNQNIEEAYELLKSYVIHVHCKDRGREEEKERLQLSYNKGLQSVPAGNGYLPIAKMIHRLKQDDYEGYITAEHFGMDHQLWGIYQSALFLSEQLQ